MTLTVWQRRTRHLPTTGGNEPGQRKRMTSDIEALSILFQDGIINLAVQGLTLV